MKVMSRFAQRLAPLPRVYSGEAWQRVVLASSAAADDYAGTNSAAAATNGNLSHLGQPQPQQSYQQPHEQPYQPAPSAPLAAQQDMYPQVEAPAGMPAGGDLPVCDFDADCINTVALAGRVVEQPSLRQFAAGSCVLNTAILLFPRPPVRPWKVNVEAWNAVARDMAAHIRPGMYVTVNGHLSVDRQRSGVQYGSLPLKVVLDSWWLLNEGSVPPETIAAVELSPLGAPPQTPREPKKLREGPQHSERLRQAAWQLVMQQKQDFGTASMTCNVQVSTLVNALLEQEELQPQDMDWPFVCSQLRLTPDHIPAGELQEALEQAAAATQDFLPSGEPRKKTLRDWLLGSPQFGPRVLMQEQQMGSPSITYMQISALLRMRKRALRVWW